ncbi:hypothetical protein HYALB_00000276 [Hymenoscyphus albidus]|uniref:Uncharacterized protein n=1 Tax=Hymenoscyphus albidus TaxID=595503 RepID=A0A9N9LSN6_9HELO|nr:hypothetical protein HYALB_00000276 [Hymenoscyphus albidus]
MSPRSGIRNVMAASVEEREEVESPMARRERHRRFLENRRRRTTARELSEERTDYENYEKKKGNKKGGVWAEGTGSEAEAELGDGKKKPPPPPPSTPPVVSPPAVSPPATSWPPLATTKPAKTLLDAPNHAPPRKGAESPAKSDPPPLPPPPPPPPANTPAPPPAPVTTPSSSTSRSLSIATPITHAPFKGTLSTPETAKATPSPPPAPVAALPALANPPPPPPPPPASPSSTPVTSTSVSVAPPTTLLSSISTIPVPIPKATPQVPAAAAPPKVTPAGVPDPDANAQPGPGKRIGGSSTTPIAAGTAAPNIQATPAPESQPDVTVTRKDNRPRTIGITLGVIFGSLALIFFAWLLIGKKARQLRKRRDEEHEKEEIMFAGAGRGSSGIEPTTWNGATTDVPETSAPSVVSGNVGGIPAALPSYPVYTNQTTYPPTVTTPTMPDYVNKPAFAPAPLAVREREPEPEMDEAKAPASWRDSIATVSTIVSVARFRTVKSWAWDQRKRNLADSKIPDVPAMPPKAPYRQLD